jgi:tetratricopeptide (TPR) repeat protein
MSRFRQLITAPSHYPIWSVLAVAALAATGYFLWEATPGARFRRHLAATEADLAAYDFPPARRHLAECLRFRPDDAPTVLLAAQAARRDGDFDAAADLLIRYHELVGESDEQERFEWAVLSANRGQVDRVLKFLIDCLEVRHPASERILEALAQGCVYGYQFDRVRFWVEETLERYPRNPVAKLVRAQTTETLGHRDAAIGSLRELVNEYPRYGPARMELASLLLLSLEYDEAAEHFGFLHEREPDQLRPLLGLTRCREGQGRAGEMRPLLERLLQLYPQNSEVLLECGRYALKEGRFEDAEPLLRRAVELAPYDHEAHLQLGVCLQQLDRPDEAESHTKRAKQIEADLGRLEKVVASSVNHPDDPAPRLEAGEICLRNGQDAEGLRWLFGILDRVPDYKPAHKALADYFATHGDSRQAEEHRRRAR